VWSKCARGDRGVAKHPASSSHSHCACMVSSLLLAAVFRGVIGAAHRRSRLDSWLCRNEFDTGPRLSSEPTSFSAATSWSSSNSGPISLVGELQALRVVSDVNVHVVSLSNELIFSSLPTLGTSHRSRSPQTGIAAQASALACFMSTVYHRFLTALSVRPGTSFEISAHLFPI